MQRFLQLPIWQPIVRRSSIQVPVKNAVAQSTYSKFRVQDENNKNDHVTEFDIFPPRPRRRLDLTSFQRTLECVPITRQNDVIPHVRHKGERKNKSFSDNIFDKVSLCGNGAFTLYAAVLFLNYLKYKGENASILRVQSNNVKLITVGGERVVPLLKPVESVISTELLNNCELSETTSTDVENDDTSSSTRDLVEEACASFKRKSDECVGELLSRVALNFLKQNKYEEASKFFMEASKYGHVPSMYNLGVLYELGNGVERNHPQAALYYTKAADEGHVKGMFNVATFHLQTSDAVQDGSKEVGLRYMKNAADKGLAKACSYMGLKCIDDDDGDMAFKYFKIAAEKHDKTSIFNLGLCYENGIGTRQSEQLALHYYREGARMGDGPSASCLGDSFQYGYLGVQKDFRRALEWYRIADLNGEKEAQKQIDFLEGLKVKMKRSFSNCFNFHLALAQN